MTWKRMLAYITGSVDEELLLRNEYLVAENRILRRQVSGRLQLSDSDRIDLAKVGKQLGRKVLSEVAQIVRPETILGWHRWWPRSSTAPESGTQPSLRPKPRLSSHWC
jgi:putative transposase